MEHDSVKKAPGPTRMNVEDMMLSEGSQTQKDTDRRIRLIQGPRSPSNPQTQRVEWRLPRAGEGGTGSSCFMGTEVRFGTMRMFWRWLVVTTARERECASCHPTIYLKELKS